MKPEKLQTGSEAESEKNAGPRKANLKQADLLEVIAHDLRNSAGGILAASQYLIEDAARQLEEHQLKLLRSIESSSGLMLRLIESLSEIPAALSKEFRLEFAPTDITWLVDQSVALHQPLAERKGVRLELNIDRGVPALNIDSGKMSQAIDGLIVDAIRRSQERGRIELQVTGNAEEAILMVRDEGPGISAGDLKSLLEPSRKDRTKRGSGEAPGALAFMKVRRIVEWHHGTIRVESDPWKGMTYTLTLPVLSAAESGRHTTPHRTRLRRGKPRSKPASPGSDQ